MKKKNGFIAISILYSFFLCFVALMMGLLASYANSALILHKINTPIKYNNKDFEMLLYDLILNNNEVRTSIPNFAYGAPNTTLTSNESGLFKSSDDDGTTYYFRGNITNNYVKFGIYYWRIVRINGDRTIRMIYDGKTGHINGEDSTDRYVETSVFNSSYDDPRYVGYTYLDNDGIMQDSIIKQYLDDWYQTEIIDKGLDGYVAEGIYCNDTTSSSTHLNYTFYGAYGRNYKTSGNAPILTCPTTDKDYGGKYKLKIGLLSTDEMAMAGLGYPSSNYYATTDNYIYLNTSWYSMSPYNSKTSSSLVFGGKHGKITTGNRPNSTLAVRPVINLNEDVLVLTGNGTKDSPYVIDTN